MVLALVGLGWWSPTAWADGDPASDVLATQTLFLPQDAGASPTQQLQLERLLQEAAGSGYPLRVAVVGSASDLGSIAELWSQPSLYARFLGQELSQTYSGTLLVVMPNGFGVVRQGQALASGEAALSGIRLAPSGLVLGAAVLQAIRRLTSGAGHPLPLPPAVAPASAHASDSVAWIVFVAGALLIALAWLSSLRARPLGAPVAGS